MKIKFLAVIVSFLIVSIAVSSCLDSEENYEFSSDATIHAFGLDTVYGRHYQFSIDQLNRLIYNKDSMPMGAADSILNRILIDTMSVSGWITSGINDTLFVMNDSVDLTPAINKSGNEGMKFKVHAPDQLTIREYTLQIRVHKQDPDSLMWKSMKDVSAVFSETTTPNALKTVLLGTDLWVFTSNTTAYKTSTEPNNYNWSTVSVANLPADAKLTSAINFLDKLYMATTNGDVYASSNGSVWSKIDGLSTKVESLIACFPQNPIGNLEKALMTGIQRGEDNNLYFCTTTDGLTWERNEAVPYGFPTENISYTALKTANGVNRVVLVGMPETIDKHTTPWYSLKGTGWADLFNSTNSFCPSMANPFIMYYGDVYYCFGGNLDAIYTSSAAIAWSKTEEKFLLPEEFKNKTSYSITVDKNNYIWVVFGGNNTKNEVWRGRLNRLGFKEQ